MNDLAESIMSAAVYLQSKIDGKSYCKTNGQFWRHINSHSLTYREYYEKYVTGVSRECVCGNPLTFYQKTETYANSCGDPKCVGRSVSQTKQTWNNEKKFLDSQNKKIAAAKKTQKQKDLALEKARITFRSKYGVEWGSSLELQKEKSRRTKLARYGDERYNNRAAISAINLAKPIEEKNAINAKRRATNLEKYGVENLLMSYEVRSKSARSNSIGKEYSLPSGKTIRVRGHEPLVLDHLLYQENYLEDQIIADNSNNFRKNAIPVFEYTDVARHIMKYYPDIYIPNENRIIEVKSEWWWDGYGAKKYQSRLGNNLRKRQAVVEKGYNYEVWIYSDKKTYRVLKNESDFQTEYKKIQSFNT